MVNKYIQYPLLSPWLFPQIWLISHGLFPNSLILYHFPNWVTVRVKVGVKVSVRVRVRSRFRVRLGLGLALGLGLQLGLGLCSGRG